MGKINVKPDKREKTDVKNFLYEFLNYSVNGLSGLNSKATD